MCDAEREAVNRQRQEALGLLNVGAYQQAEPGLRMAVESTYEQKNAESFMWARRLTESLIGQGKIEEAEPFARRALRGFSRWGAKDEDALDCKYLLAEVLNGQGQFGEADDLAREALQGFEQNLKRGPDHLTALKCKALCAAILNAQGHAQAARELAESARESLDSAIEKMDVLVAQGLRRPTTVDHLAIRKAEVFLSKVFGENVSRQKKTLLPSRETMSTHIPDSDSEACSRFSSRLPSKE